VLLAACVFLAVAALALLPSTTHASSAPVHARGPEAPVYVVQPGDTLWSIAREQVASGDIRAEVDRLARLNGSAAVVTGEHIRLTAPPGS